MIERTTAELEKEVESIFDVGRGYRGRKSTVTRLGDRWVIEIENMYKYVELTFEKLCKLSEFLGTKNIDDSRHSHAGCETCDYGSEYIITLTVGPDA